jgi:hypothetical protein
MRNIRTAVLAGVAALAAAGTAVAASNDMHVMTVGLPDGAVARIHYRGDVAPVVRIEPTAIPIRFADPLDAAPFAMFDRDFADLDRQAAVMMRQAQALREAQAGGPGLDLATFGSLPAGTISYRFVSTSDGNRVCTQSWRLTSQGAGQQPKLVSASSGDCGSPAAGANKAVKPAKPAATGQDDPAKTV